MSAKFKRVRLLQQDESGQTLVEYGFLILLIALVVAAVLPSVGTTIASMFSAVASVF